MDFKLIFLGMNSAFSVPPFRALVSAGCKPAALVTPWPPQMAGRFRQISYPQPDPHLTADELNLHQLAARHHIPTYEVGEMQEPQALAFLKGLKSDLLVAACFPRLLPVPWLNTPRLGALNLHPSLLPAYRGPQPLFWQFRAGETATGVTLHWMDSGADTGDIVAQAGVPFPEGIAEPEAERLAGERGAQLLLSALAEPENLPRSPQPRVGASYQPQPGPQDMRIPESWSARRAFNFMRAAQAWGPFEVQQGAVWVRVARAESLVQPEHAASLPEPESGTGWLTLRDGAVLGRFSET